MDNNLKIKIDSKDIPDVIKAIAGMTCQKIIVVGLIIIAIIAAFKY